MNSVPRPPITPVSPSGSAGSAPPLRSGKVGVLTFHRCFNYGSYWQARCLVEGLRAAGHDAELLDHSSDVVERAEARCLMQPTLPVRSPRGDLPAYKAKGRRFVDAIRDLPRSAEFPLHAPEAVQGYRTVVVGSDEVWNFRHPWYGGNPIFFGGGIAADRIVSYAASFGNHDTEDGMRQDYAAKLGGFSSLSVRDANSLSLVRQAGFEPAMVLDPCLQFPDPARLPPADEATPYAAVYGHGFPDWFAARIAAWARDTGLRLVSIGYRNDFADEQRLDAGPLAFAELMAGASAVVTNFFHGCVFALLNDKPLVSVPSAYRFNKVRDLAALLGWPERLVSEATSTTSLAGLLATPPGSAVQARIAALRVQSAEYLRAALA